MLNAILWLFCLRSMSFGFFFFLVVLFLYDQILAVEHTPVGAQTPVVYYSIEPHVDAALKHISEFYRNRNGQIFRLYVDRMMPLELRQIDYQPAGAAMRKWCPEFFGDQNLDTGLLPVGGVPTSSVTVPAINDRSKHMFPGTLYRSTQFVLWFPEDSCVSERCKKLASSFIRYFLSLKGGLYPAVEAGSGEGVPGAQNVIAYGEAVAGLALIGSRYKNDELLDVAKSISKWVSDFSMNFCKGLIPEKFTETAGIASDFSTDGIYWIRALETAYQTTGDDHYKNLIVSHGRVYYEAGWSEEYQHFSTHIQVRPDILSPTGRIYGDSKHNYMALLCLLTRMTGEYKYMNRFDAVWNLFMREAYKGWVPAEIFQGRQTIRAGKAIEAKEQSVFLDSLLDAYETTKDGKYLQWATEWVNKLLTPDGREHWRGDGIGAGLIRFARLKHQVSLLEVQCSESNFAGLQLLSGTGKTLFNAPIPAPTAVFYVQPGAYTVRAIGYKDLFLELAPDEKQTIVFQIKKTLSPPTRLRISP